MEAFRVIPAKVISGVEIDLGRPLLSGLLDPAGIGGVEFFEQFVPERNALYFGEPCGLVVAFAGFLPAKGTAAALGLRHDRHGWALPAT